MYTVQCTHMSELNNVHPFSWLLIENENLVGEIGFLFVWNHRISLMEAKTVYGT